MTLDIVQDYAMECSMDPKASRFIQDRLALNIDQEEQRRFYDKLLSDIRMSQLMIDLSGNYVVQRILENDDKVHEKVLEHLRGRIVFNSKHRHGCRVVQVAFKEFKNPLRDEMLEEMQEDFITCSMDFNGNHVI